MVLPIGSAQTQMLVAVEKRRGAVSRREIANCLFVPLIGRHGWPAEDVE